MKTANDVVKGKIVDYNEKTGEVTIKATYSDLYTLIKRNYQECNVQMIDSRHLSNKQRNACYAMLKEIADFAGMGLEMTKEWTKLRFVTDDLGMTADNIFSLSDAPMSVVCAFQRFLVRLIIDYDIPTNFPMLDMVDDYKDYVYACWLKRKCIICGRGGADVHHCNPIGMGADRKTMVHEGLEVMPLCRVHHNEIHQYPKEKFNEMYHVDGGVILDKALCKALGLKAGKDEID